MTKSSISTEQLSICLKARVNPQPPEVGSKVGISLSVRGSSGIVHGLRHLPTETTNGWYLWTGDLSQDPSFFKPLHVEHIEDWRPGISRFLALPPGWRFLWDGSYEDIWFDESLIF